MNKLHARILRYFRKPLVCMHCLSILLELVEILRIIIIKSCTFSYHGVDTNIFWA